MRLGGIEHETKWICVLGLVMFTTRYAATEAQKKGPLTACLLEGIG
jgi:hypothetical protein